MASPSPTLVRMSIVIRSRDLTADFCDVPGLFLAKWHTLNSPVSCMDTDHTGRKQLWTSLTPIRTLTLSTVYDCYSFQAGFIKFIINLLQAAVRLIFNRVIGIVGAQAGITLSNSRLTRTRGSRGPARCSRGSSAPEYAGISIHRRRRAGKKCKDQEE